MRTSTRAGRPVALVAAAATTLALVVVGGAPAASAAVLGSVEVTVTLGGAPAAGAFVAVRTAQGEALGGTTTDVDGTALVALRTLADESTLRVVASSTDALVGAPATVSGGVAHLDLVGVPASVSDLTYANTYGSQVEDLAGDGQSGVFYAITSTTPSVWRSSDYAGTWSATPTVINSAASGLPQSRAQQLVTSGYPGEVAVVLRGGPPDNADQLWFSRDYGTTWTEVPQYRSIAGTKTVLWAHSATAAGADSSYLMVSSPQGLLPFVMPSGANGRVTPYPPYAAVAGIAASAQVALATAPDGQVLLLAAGATDATLYQLPVGLSSTAGMVTRSPVTIPFFGRTTSDPGSPFAEWGAEDVVHISSLATPDHVAVLVYDRSVASQSWSGVLKTAVVDRSVDPAVVVTNRTDAGTFALAMGNQGNGSDVDPVAFVADQTAVQNGDCGENSTPPVGTLADAVPSGPAAGFGLVGSVRSCMVTFNATDTAAQWNGTGGSVAARTAAVVPVNGINNNVGFVFDSRFFGTNAASEPVEVAISGDGQFGVRKSAAFDASGRFDFGGRVNTVSAFLTRRATPGTAADSGGVAVMGMVAPSVSDEVVSPTDLTGSTYLTSLASSGGAQVLLTTDAGASFSTAAVFGADRLAWWHGPADHQWILGEGWDRLRPKPFTASTGTGPLDMGDELAATAAQRNDPTPDGSPFLIPETPATLGGVEYNYDSLVANKQGRIMVTAMAGVPGADRAVVGVSDGSSPQSLNRGTLAVVDLTWPDNAGTQAGLRTTLGAVRYFGPGLPAAGTTSDAQAGFGVGRTSSYDARINAAAICPDVDGTAASVRDTAFVSVSGRGIDKITGIGGASPTWSTTGITTGNYRDLDVDCDTGVLAATPDIPWAVPSNDRRNRLVDVSTDGAATFTTITPTTSSTLPPVGGLSVAVAASAVDNQLTLVVGGEAGVIAGLVLQLTDIPAGGADIEVPAELVQIVNGAKGRAVGMVSALDLAPAPSDPVVGVAPASLMVATARTVMAGAVAGGSPLAVGSGAGAFSTLARTVGGTRTARITAPTSLTLLSTSVRVSWASTGVVRSYAVQRAVKAPGRALGSYAAWTTTTLSSRLMTGARPGYGYCFRVRAVTGKGATAWSAPRCTTVLQDDRALVAGRGWARGKARTAYLGTVTTSSTRNAALTLAVSRGSKLVLMVTKKPGGGTLAVYVGRRRVALVATASRTVIARSIVVISVRTSGTPVVIRVYSPGKSGVVVDGVAQLP